MSDKENDDEETKKDLIGVAGAAGVGAVVAGIPGALVGAVVGVIASELNKNKE